jgi:hypothetical protein
MAQTLEITVNDDGSFTCSAESASQESAEGPESQEAPGEDQGQTFKDPSQVLAWVREQLAGVGGSQDPQAAWNQEAAQRDPQGYRQPGGAPAMTM